jgi:hypothetical protein
MNHLFFGYLMVHCDYLLQITMIEILLPCRFSLMFNQITCPLPKYKIGKKV